MRESLAQALTDFEGALIVVAHDRHLLSAATDQWMLVADGVVRPFEGDLDDYKDWARQYHARAASGGKPRSGSGEREVASGATRKEERRAEAGARRRESEARKPFEKKLQAIEKQLEPLTREAKETEAWLASSEAYEESHKERLQATLRQRGELAERIRKLEDDWLWAQAQLEKEIEKARRA
jgi:ATP-binding cassette subfamily F protein 3